MISGCEGEVAVGFSPDGKDIWLGKFSRIAIGCTDAQGKVGSRLQGDTANSSLLHNEPIAQLIGAFNTQAFFNCGHYQIRLGTQLIDGIGVREQQSQGAADQIGGRLVPGIEEENAVVQELPEGEIRLLEQPAQQIIVGRMRAPMGYQNLKVLSELANRAITCLLLLFSQHGLERTEYGQ